MKKLLLSSIFIFSIITICLVNTSLVHANHLPAFDECENITSHCPSNTQCKQATGTIAPGVVGDGKLRCLPLTGVSTIFGRVDPPTAIETLGLGSGGINNFLNMLIILIYIIAGIVFVFMILWGAFQFLTSGGNKESLDSARKRITFALIGIALFATAFAVISLVGRFTGFTFFSTQTSIGCTTPSRYFIDPGTLKCFQSVWRNNVPHAPGRCTEVFIEVEDRFCR